MAKASIGYTGKRVARMLSDMLNGQGDALAAALTAAVENDDRDALLRCMAQAVIRNGELAQVIALLAADDPTAAETVALQLQQKYLRSKRLK